MADPPRKKRHRETSFVRSCSSSELLMEALKAGTLRRRGTKEVVTKVDSDTEETSVSEHH